MKITIHINKVTELNIETYTIMEKELEEPIWDIDENKMNYKMFSFYFIIQLSKPYEKNLCYNLFEDIRLYSNYIKLKTKTECSYVLFRAVSDNIQTVVDSINQLKHSSKNTKFKVLNQNVEISQLIEIDEYNLGRFLDTEIDKAIILFS